MDTEERGSDRDAHVFGNLVCGISVILVFKEAETGGLLVLASLGYRGRSCLKQQNKTNNPSDRCTRELKLNY